MKRDSRWWHLPPGYGVLLAATILAVMLVSASQQFVSRIDFMLERQASELLAADLVVSTPEALAPEWRDKATELGLKSALTATLRTAVFIDDEPQMLALKAVDSAYPLRGQLQLVKEAFATPYPAPIVGPGESVWLDLKLANQLKRSDSLEIGLLKLPVQAWIEYEPDRGGSLFNLAPRAMISLDLLEKSGLVLPGSRVRWRLLVAGSVEQVEAFKQWIEPQLEAGQRLQGLDNARPEMRQALERTQRFLGLAIITTLMIATASILIASRYAARQEMSKIAVLRVFGVSRKQLLRWVLGRLLLLSLLAGVLGSALAALLQWPLDGILGQFFGDEFPPAGWQPYALGMLAGFLTLFGFSLPAVLGLMQVAPIQVLRQQELPTGLRGILLWLFLSLCLFLLMWLVLQDFTLVSRTLPLLIAVFFSLPLLALLLLRGLRGLFQGSFLWKAWIVNRLLDPGRNSLSVLSGFSITLLAVMILVFVRNDLLSGWQAQLPQDSPNFFVINVPADDQRAFAEQLQQRQMPASPLYAVIRSRLTAINGEPIEALSFSSERGQRMANHIFNLSWADTVPADNEIVAGDWFQAGQKDGFSLEAEIAEAFGVGLGDRLSFDIAGQSVTQTVVSLRTVKWDNFRPNFYVLGSPDLLSHLPHTWLTSFYVGPDQRSDLPGLVRTFPSISLLDVGALMQRVRGLVDRAAMAMEAVLSFSMLAALLVLLAALQAGRAQRGREIALLKTLGASRRQILRSQWLELGFSGALAGFFAAFFATLVAWVVSTQLLGLTYQLNPWLWLVSIVSGAVLVGLVGRLSISRALRIEPMQMFRSQL